jgi:hypothetical protein
MIMKNPIKYFLLSVLFWVAVEWTTAFQPNLSRWISYMPAIWIFYIGSPLAFAFLIYKLRVSDRMLFICSVVLIFIVEILFTGNAMLYTFPIMLIALPASLLIYGMITFAPKWIAEGKIKDNRKKLAIMIIAWVLISVSTYINNAR